MRDTAEEGTAMKERLQALMEQKIREWQRADIPKKFSCGEKKFGARQFIGFILCTMLVCSRLAYPGGVRQGL